MSTTPAEAKKPRAAAPPKPCGFPGCTEPAAAGGKIRVTILEDAAAYPTAQNRLINTCKTHRVCVGVHGYSEKDLIEQDHCSTTAKVIFKNRLFCDSCHCVFLESIIDLTKPRLTEEEVIVARKKFERDPTIPLKPRVPKTKTKEEETSAPPTVPEQDVPKGTVVVSAPEVPKPPPKPRGKAAKKDKEVKPEDKSEVKTEAAPEEKKESQVLTKIEVPVINHEDDFEAEAEKEIKQQAAEVIAKSLPPAEEAAVTTPAVTTVSQPEVEKKETPSGEAPVKAAVRTRKPRTAAI